MAAIAFFVSLYWIVVVTITYLIGSFVLSGAFFMVSWLVGLSFGGLPFVISGIIQAAAEPTPPGDWRLVNVTWANRTRQRRGLLWRHSNPYTDPKVAAQIAEWIQKAVTTSPSTI
jgi:hypothetical protein